MRTPFTVAAAAFAIAFASPHAAHAQGGTGLGIIVGEPTGLSAKTWVGANSALDLGLAWSFVDDGAAHVHGDYLVHNFSLFDTDRGALPLYYGIGMRAIVRDDDARLGLRVPVGLAYIFGGSQADVFFELAPILDLTPETEFRLNGAAGIRYFFR
jgi:hypothetical protein